MDPEQGTQQSNFKEPLVALALTILGTLPLPVWIRLICYGFAWVILTDAITNGFREKQRVSVLISLLMSVLGSILLLYAYNILSQPSLAQPITIVTPTRPPIAGAPPSSLMAYMPHISPTVIPHYHISGTVLWVNPYPNIAALVIGRGNEKHSGIECIDGYFGTEFKRFDHAECTGWYHFTGKAQWIEDAELKKLP